MAHICATSTDPFVSDVHRIDTIANLRLISPPTFDTVFVAEGSATPGDGGEHIYYWDSASVLADNGSTVIAPSVGGVGRWRTILDTGLRADLASTTAGLGATLVANTVRVFNVKNYGAVGDGVTNDLAAIQAAIDAAGDNGTIYYPLQSSFYAVNGTLLFDDFQVHQGDAWVEIRQTGGAVTTFKSRNQATISQTFVRFENLSVINNTLSVLSDEACIGLDMTNVSHFTLEHCRVRQFGRGVVLGNEFSIAGAYYNNLLDCEIASNKIGIYGKISSNSTRVTGGRIFSNREGIKLTATTNDFGCIGASFESNKIGFHTFTNVSDVNLVNCRYEGNNREITLGTGALTRSGAIATAVFDNHRFETGDSVVIAGAVETEYNGIFTVTVSDWQTFTYTVTGTPATPATGTITAKLQKGGAVVCESGSFNNFAYGGHWSGVDDRFLDFDGRNGLVGRGGVIAPSSKIGSPTMIAGGTMGQDANADGIADGWTVPSGVVAGMVCSLDTVTFKTGVQAQKINVNAGTIAAARHFARVVRVTPNVPYCFTAIVRTDFDFGWNIRVGPTATTATYYNGQIRNVGDWIVMRGSFVPTTAEAHIYFFMNGTVILAQAAAKNLWIDSFIIGPGLLSAEPGDSNRTIAPSRLTANLPTNPELGELVVDSQFAKPLFHDGTVWRDADGNSASATPSVTAAASITLPAGEIVTVTGNTNIDTIVATSRVNSRVTLVFSGTPTVGDGTGNLRLAGNFVATADDTLSLVCNGTNWFETSRSTN